VERLPQPDLVLDDRPVREGEPQPPGGLVPVGANLDEGAVVDAGQEAAVLADQVEPAVLGDAEALEHDPLGMVEGEALHRRDREPCDRRHAGRLVGARPGSERC
jgi:hypothetical protein